MNLGRLNNFKSILGLAGVLALTLPVYAADPADEAAATRPQVAAKQDGDKAMAADVIEALKLQLAAQQKQIDELKTALTNQLKMIEGVSASNASANPGAGFLPKTGQPEIASASPVLPVGSTLSPVSSISPSIGSVQGPTQAGGGADIAKKVDGLIKNLGGIRIGGDFRVRFDSINRKANSIAGAAQNERTRYRFRLNFDKDLYLNAKDEAAGKSWAKLHFQLASAPINNPLTNDTDFTGVTTRAAISIGEAYVDVLPLKNLTLRVGRTPEIFADNAQFVWDDDVRFNGFHETYHVALGKNGFMDIKAAQYILTNPNIQQLAAGNAYTTAGYRVGVRVPSSAMFDQGATFGMKSGKITQSVSGDFILLREPNQIQLASTTAGSAVIGAPEFGVIGLSGNLPQTGNGTTTAGGAILTARDYHVIHGAYNFGYTGLKAMGHDMPFAAFIQGTHNLGADFENNGWAIGATIGQTAKHGDFLFGYRYFHKEANAFISQFSDDDVGTGLGVNINTHAIRADFGITRFLAWENRFYFQDEISKNNPAKLFFVPLQAGANLTTRIQTQFNFKF